MSSTDGASKSAVISALVQRLREGKITKTVLFEKLTQLHRGESVDLNALDSEFSVAASNDAEARDATVEGPALSPGGASRVPRPATAEKNAIIQRLLEQTRANQGMHASPGPASLGPAPGAVAAPAAAAAPPQPPASASVPPSASAAARTPAAVNHAAGTPISVEQFMSAQPGAAAQAPYSHSGRRGVGGSPGAGATPGPGSGSGGRGGTPSRSRSRGVPPPPVFTAAATPRSTASGRPGSARQSQRSQSARRSRPTPRSTGRFGGAPGPMTPGGPAVDAAGAPYWESSAPKAERLSDLQECTFKPQIRPLPASYGASGKPLQTAPFQTRIKEWQLRKELEAQKKRAEEENKDLEGCTFQPRINDRSRRTASQTRPDASLPVSERLYNYSADRRGLSVSRERTRASSSYETKEEEELRTECTFEPKINRNRDATPVRARYLDHTQSSRQAGSRAGPGAGAGSAYGSASGVPSARPSPLPSGMEECTFTPQVNPPPSHMGSVQLYLQADPFERLSRTRGPVDASAAAQAAAKDADADRFFDRDDDMGRPVLDMSAFLSAMENRSVRSGSGTPRRSSSVPRGRPGRSRSVSRSGRDGDDADGSGSVRSLKLGREEREKRFQAFLARQTAAEMRRSRKIKAVTETMTPHHTPKLCKKSKNIVASSQLGSFLQRVEKNSLRKEHRALQAKAVTAHDPECTFKPKINPHSQSLQKRSVVEMSRGDMLKKETAQRLMRLKAEQEQLDGLTFQPEINPVSRQMEGRLKLLAEPETYLERVQREQKLFSDRQRRATQEAEMQEFAECTFRPEIHDAPGYVKRIARSMALTRAAQPATDKKERPQWR